MLHGVRNMRVLIEREAGGAFDPVVARAMLRVLDQENDRVVEQYAAARPAAVFSTHGAQQI